MGKVLIDSVNNDQEIASVSKPDDIHSLLDGYSESMEIDNTPLTDDSITNDNSSLVDWSDKSNSDIYYVRGPKKGQRKPNAGKTIKKKGSYGTSSVSGELISGILFITIIDQLLPAFIAFANNKVSNDKVKASDMQLSAKQKNELSPICDDIIRQWEISANPALILGLSLVGIYGMNFLALKGS